jgi:hypothetical protein
MGTSITDMILHFVWIGHKFWYPFYLGILSANKIVDVDKTIVWTIDPPTDNLYWNMLSDVVDIKAVARPSLPHDESYWDWERDVITSNYLRFDVLHKHGGIYMDTDTLTLKDFSYLLEDHEAVLSDYANSESVRLARFGDVRLQNAIMLARQGSEFMLLAREACVSILEDGWRNGKRRYQGAFSGPGAVTQVYAHYDKSKIGVCSKHFFFPFPPKGVRVFSEGFKTVYPNLHVLHYYTSIVRSQVANVTPDFVASSHSVYATLVKSVLSEKEWRVK